MIAGYAVNTLADLLAIESVGLINNFALRVASENCWYQYKSSAVTGLIPDDNPITGRWMPDLEALNRILTDSSGSVLVGTNGNVLYL